MKKVLFTLCFFSFLNFVFAQDLKTTEIIVIEGFEPKIPHAVKINKQASFSDTTKIDKSQNYTQIALALFLLGIFASIYHPVGIAMLAEGKPETMGRRLAFNGVWGNLGVAFSTITAAGLANLLGWQAAFYIPGIISFAIGVLWLMFKPKHVQSDLIENTVRNKSTKGDIDWLTIFKIIAFSSIIIGFMFNIIPFVY